MVNTEKRLLYFTTGSVFLFLFIFFTFVQPLAVFDGDDWAYLSMHRAPIPKIGDWNPTRILPEVLLPVVGYLAAYVIYPFSGDYIFSITLSAAFTVATFAVLLCLSFIMLCTRALHLTTIQTSLCTILFFSLHFLFFRSQPSNNQYMLGSGNFVCYFYYVIPNLLNSSIVLFMLSHKNIQQHFLSLSSFQKGTVLLAFYFAIFSNLLNSYILGVFCGSALFISFLQQSGSIKERIKASYTENRILFYTVLVWLFSAACEAGGGRARSIGGHPLQLYDATKATYKLFAQTGRYTLLLIIALLIGLLVIYWKKRKSNVTVWTTNEKKVLSICILSIIGSMTYLILLCSKAGAGYASQTMVQYGTCFYILILLFTIFSAILRHLHSSDIVLPLLTVLVVLLSATCDYPLSYSTMGNIPPRDAMAVSRNLVSQIKAADAAKQKEMVLIVPKGDNRDNWPHPNYMGNNISRTLFSHGQIERNIKIKIQPDPEMNKTYYHK